MTATSGLKLSSDNEWDPLQAVIVGTVDGFSPGVEFASRVTPELREKAVTLARRLSAKLLGRSRGGS